MKNLELFLSYLCGEFNNDEQVAKELEYGEPIHPKAKHISAIANSKINNLPDGFKGKFVIEESYYDNGKFKNILPHLFLFEENKDRDVVLISYDLPEGVSKEDFRNNNDELKMDYNKLKVSEKFTPMIYKFVNNGFEGESVSSFSPGTTFKLKERTEEKTLYVSEVFEKDGKVTFGCVDPIVFKKIK